MSMYIYIYTCIYIMYIERWVHCMRAVRFKPSVNTQRSHTWALFIKSSSYFICVYMMQIHIVSAIIFIFAIIFLTIKLGELERPSYLSIILFHLNAYLVRGILIQPCLGTYLYWKKNNCWLSQHFPHFSQLAMIDNNGGFGFKSHDAALSSHQWMFFLGSQTPSQSAPVFPAKTTMSCWLITI